MNKLFTYEILKVDLFKIFMIFVLCVHLVSQCYLVQRKKIRLLFHIFLFILFLTKHYFLYYLKISILILII